MISDLRLDYMKKHKSYPLLIDLYWVRQIYTIEAHLLANKRIKTILKRVKY